MGREQPLACRTVCRTYVLASYQSCEYYRVKTGGPSWQLRRRIERGERDAGINALGTHFSHTSLLLFMGLFAEMTFHADEGRPECVVPFLHRSFLSKGCQPHILRSAAAERRQARTAVAALADILRLFIHRKVLTGQNRIDLGALVVAGLFRQSDSLGFSSLCATGESVRHP